MTANKNLKRQVRARAAKTGESYTAALRHVRPPAPVSQAPAAETPASKTATGQTPASKTAAGQTAEATGPEGPRRLRLAVAQTTAPGDPRDHAALRAAGAELRRLMRAASAAGARLVHFPEGATCCPHKRAMSVSDDEVGPADWSRLDRGLLRAELTAIRDLARELGLWTVLGSVHPLTAPNRPHNSLYVIAGDGRLVTRYDERYLSSTKLSYLYTPGAAAVTFTVEGMRFGCAVGLETHFPEVFAQYERLGADCVLFSTHGPGTPVNDGPMAAQAAGHAAVNGYWVSYAVVAADAANAPAGIASPDGRWAARCPAEAAPALAVADLERPATSPRPWRRHARSGIYEPHQAHGDARSADRAAF
jgi:predicted amidohydrolase